MHIGILQCGHTPDQVGAVHGDFDDLFIRLFDGHGLTFTTWNVVDMEFPDGIDAAEGVTMHELPVDPKDRQAVRRS